MELVKEKYKQTEIGAIPVDWELVKISSLCNVVRGGSPRPAGDPRYFFGDFIPWLTVGSLTNISSSSLYVTTTASKLTLEGSRLSRNLEIGTPIIANSGFSLGIAKILNIECCANDGIAALLNFDVNKNKEFLIYYLNTLTNRLRKVIAIGNDQPNLNTERIGNILIPYPKSKREQDLIVEVLSDVDNYILKLEKLIAKKIDIKQATLNVLFIAKKDWGEYTLENLEKMGYINLSRGKVISQKDIVNKQGNYPIYSSSIHNNGLFGYYGDYDFQEELITWSVDGGGDFFYRPKHKFSVTNVCGVLKVNSNLINCHFLASQLQMLHSKLHFDYTLKAHPSIIRKAYTIVLPKIEEQIQLASLISDMENEIKALRTKLEKYKNIKQGMIQNLLTGKIRLV
jgi:type I restriction enzyme S subunit